MRSHFSMRRKRNFMIDRLKYKPKDWGILVNRGDAYKELGRDDEAIFDY